MRGVVKYDVGSWIVMCVEYCRCNKEALLQTTSVAVVGRWADKLTRSVAFSALTQLPSVFRYVVVVVDISWLPGPNKLGIQHSFQTHRLVDIGVVVHTDPPKVR